ncbi:MAG: hypothetical protein H7222_00615 [Methylotenera sp.]|nr:hypothetical protein [Oligoflexia bacterium]
MKLKNRFSFSATTLGMLLTSNGWAIQPQPVPVPEDSSVSPQINISGVGIATGSYGRRAGQSRPKSLIDYEDSTLQIGAAQSLYKGAIGSMGFGMLTLGNEGEPGNTPFFLSQAFLDYQGEKIEFLVGRSDNPTAHLVDFPTLRDDDLHTLNNPLNPLSNGTLAQDHRYSNVAAVTLNQGLKFFENVHAQQLVDSAGIQSSPGINSYGATFQYLSTPGMEAFSKFPSLGLGVEHLTSVGAASSGLYQIYGGGVMNLNESVTDRWDIRALDIVSVGSDLRSFSNARDTFEANSNTLSAALRYMHSPFGRAGYQLSLTAGYKNYFRVRSSRSAGFALTYVKRLGEGFDFVAQYQGQYRKASLSAAESGSLAFEQTGEVGFSFNWDATFNQHLSPRRTILNQQYQYVPN